MRQQRVETHPDGRERETYRGSSPRKGGKRRAAPLKTPQDKTQGATQATDRVTRGSLQCSNNANKSGRRACAPQGFPAGTCRAR